MLDFMERHENLAWALCLLVLGAIVGVAVAQWVVPFASEWLRPMPPFMVGVSA